MPESIPSRAGALVPLTYGGKPIHDRGEMVSLTDMWRAAGADPSKQPAKWRELLSTQDFAAHLADVILRKSEDGLFESKRGIGGGTWAHWQLGLAYARYRNHDFHAWANTVIRERMEDFRATPQITANPADPATVLQVIQHLKAQIAVQGQRVAALDRLEGAEGSRCITDTAKLLKMSRDALARWMVANRWIYRRTGTDTWVAYRDKEQAMLLEHVPYHYTGREDTPRVKMQLLVTPRGLSKLAGMHELEVAE